MQRYLSILAVATSIFAGCSEDDRDTDYFAPGLSPTDQSRDQQNANLPGQIGRLASSLGTSDLTVLGENANANQAAFRQRFGLTDPTQDQMAGWQQYDVRFTEYSDKDSEYLFSLLLGDKELMQNILLSQ